MKVVPGALSKPRFGLDDPKRFRNGRQVGAYGGHVTDGWATMAVTEQVDLAAVQRDLLRKARRNVAELRTRGNE